MRESRFFGKAAKGIAGAAALFSSSPAEAGNIPPSQAAERPKVAKQAPTETEAESGSRTAMGKKVRGQAKKVAERGLAEMVSSFEGQEEKKEGVVKFGEVKFVDGNNNEEFKEAVRKKIEELLTRLPKSYWEYVANVVIKDTSRTTPNGEPVIQIKVSFLLNRDGKLAGSFNGNANIEPGPGVDVNDFKELCAGEALDQARQLLAAWLGSESEKRKGNE